MSFSIFLFYFIDAKISAREVVFFVDLTAAADAHFSSVHRTSGRSIGAKEFFLFSPVARREEGAVRADAPAAIFFNIFRFFHILELCRIKLIRCILKSNYKDRFRRTAPGVEACCHAG